MIYEIFKDKVDRFPDFAAIVTEKGETFTYEQADAIVERFAHYLLAQGVKQGQRVAVLTCFESAHIWFYLALNRLGACYVPFDATDFAPQQLKADLTNLEIPHLFTDEALAEKYNLPPEKVRLFETAKVYAYRSEGKPLPEIVKDKSTEEYIVCSSGSMGLRKYIPIMSEPSGFAYWEKIEENELNLKPGHRVLCGRSPAYDARLSEYLRAFIAGGTLYQVPLQNRKDIEYVINFCGQHGIETLLFISSILNKQPTDTIKRLKNAGVKNIIVTGDACSLEVLEECELQGINLYIAYGQTETTFGSVISKANGKKIYDENGRRIIPIGEPVGEVKYHLINGMLYVESPFISPGYIGNDEKNKETFVTIDIEGKPTRVLFSGDKFTKIGDAYSFLGRVASATGDKFTGVMVDTLSVEYVLLDYKKYDSNLVDACVVKKNDTIVAYIVVKEGFNKQRLIKHIEGWLSPSYLPKKIIVLDAIPQHTVSEKQDRQQLIARVDNACEELVIEDEESSLSDGFSSEDEFYQAAIAKMHDLMMNNPTKAIKIAKGILDLHHCDLQFTVSPKYTTAAQSVYSKLGHEYNPEENSFIKIKTCWENVLENTLTSLRINFLYSGGDSIRAMALAGHIKAEIDSEYTYTQMISVKAITPFSIFYGIHFSDVRNRLELIRELRPTAKHRVNYFFLPPISGDAFAYTGLAETISQFYDGNLFGVTLPGIFDKRMLEWDFNSVLNRMVEYIEKIQAGKPLRLIGYSGGCFWVYHIARQFIEKGYPVAEIHLIDGYSAEFYNKLSAKDYSTFVRELFNVTCRVLNNKFYQENIEEPPAFDDLPTLSKKAQVALLLNWLSTKVEKEMSRNLIGVVKQNLFFMLDEETPEILPVATVRLCYSKEDQVFHSLRGKVPEVESFHANAIYARWNHYFSSISLSEKVPNVDHFDLIKRDPITHDTPARVFFDQKESINHNWYEYDFIPPSVILERNRDNSYSAFFVYLNHHVATELYHELKEMAGFSNPVVNRFYDSIIYSENKTQNVLPYNTLFYVSVSVNEKNLASLLKIVNRFEKIESPSYEKLSIMDYCDTLLPSHKNNNFTVTLDFYTKRPFGQLDDLEYRAVFECSGPIENIQLLLRSLGYNARFSSDIESNLHFSLVVNKQFEYTQAFMRRLSKALLPLTRYLIPEVYLRHFKNPIILNRYYLTETAEDVATTSNAKMILAEIDELIRKTKRLRDEDKENKASQEEAYKTIRLARNLASQVIPDLERSIFLGDHERILKLDIRILSTLCSLLFNFPSTIVNDNCIKQNERLKLAEMAFNIAKFLEGQKSPDDIHNAPDRLWRCAAILDWKYSFSQQYMKSIEMCMWQINRPNSNLDEVSVIAKLDSIAMLYQQLNMHEEALHFAQQANSRAIATGRKNWSSDYQLMISSYYTKDYIAADHYAGLVEADSSSASPNDSFRRRIKKDIQTLFYNCAQGSFDDQKVVAKNLLNYPNLSLGVANTGEPIKPIISLLMMSMLCANLNLRGQALHYCEQACKLIEIESACNEMIKDNQHKLLALLAHKILPLKFNTIDANDTQSFADFSQMGLAFSTLTLALTYYRTGKSTKARLYFARALDQDFKMRGIIDESHHPSLCGMAYYYLALMDLDLGTREAAIRSISLLKMAIAYGNKDAEKKLSDICNFFITASPLLAAFFTREPFVGLLQPKMLFPAFALNDLPKDQTDIIIQLFEDGQETEKLMGIFHHLHLKVAGLPNAFDNENPLEAIFAKTKIQNRPILHRFSLAFIQQTWREHSHRLEQSDPEIEATKRYYIQTMHQKFGL